MFASQNGVSRLTPCVECGHLVSVTAAVCPRCKGTAPLGLPCMLCGKPIRAEELVRAHLLVCHRQCLLSRFVIPASATCPDCGVSLSDLKLAITTGPEASPGQLGCPGCGHHSPLGGAEMCSFCGLLIYNFQKQVEGRFRGYAPKEIDSRHVLHDFCAATGLAGGRVGPPAPNQRGFGDKLGAWVMRVLLGAPDDR